MDTWWIEKNEPNSNPISAHKMPKRTQTNPICRDVASGEGGSNPIYRGVAYGEAGSEAQNDLSGHKQKDLENKG